MQAVVFLILLWRLLPVASQKLEAQEVKTVEYLLSASMDVIQHTHLELWKLYLQRQSLRGNGPYEIGFLVRTTEERYRKMVDLYNTSITVDNKLRTREHIMHLQTIEKLHWDIMHLANMLHEVEKKYRIKRLSVGVALDADVEKIMSELSWNTKPQFLEYIYVKQNLTNSSSWPQKQGVRKARSLFKKPVSKIYWMPFIGETDSENAVGNKINHTDQPQLIRRVRSIDSTLLSAHEWNRSLFNTTKDEDDGVMKMKLFRLMYESVKDSDLKIKRAELVKADYENSTGFDLGYVSGDASDKLNVMNDISKTLKRMYHVWKPVEHVNAYEQIANMAIEVSHLVDMVRTIREEPRGSQQRDK